MLEPEEDRQRRIELLKLAYRRQQSVPKPRKNKSDRFYATKAWKQVRDQCIQVLGSICCRCGNDSGPCHVDHVMARRDYPRLALRLSNLQVLCKDCNFWKGHNSIDFRTDEQRKAMQDAESYG